MTVPDNTDPRDLLRDMIRVRRMEERAAQLYGEGRIRGFLHLYVGEEAVAVGAVRALGPDDTIVATYREHGHALIRGVPMAAIMSEMFGRAGGCSHGRGGSMHLFDAARRFVGGNAIVGAGLPLAVGIALADRMRDRRAVTACFFGDGAVAEGAFHESLNLAALWELPVLFCCENNRYAMGTAVDRELAHADPCALAAALDVAAISVDGMDVTAALHATRDAVDHVRHERRPRFVEYRTYRFRAHSMFDPELYRSKEEVAAWRERDPVTALSRRLVAEGTMTDPAVSEMISQVDAEVDDAVAAAEASPEVDVHDLERDVTAHGGHPRREVSA